MMSVKERRRLAVLDQVKTGDLTRQAAAARLGVSYRQMLRIYRRWEQEGDTGVVHRARGRSGNRQVDPAIREQVVALVRSRYGDFGCTLACEKLAEVHGLIIDDQTLRRWLKDAGLWRRRRKSQAKRRRRLRRACFGEMVQIDGSEHDWFEGRRPSCTLMVMIDDATGLVLSRFFEAETTVAAMTIVMAWASAYGLPGMLYPDRHSIYRVNTQAADEQSHRTGRRPLTQMGRALEQLGVSLVCAKTPQAKGRVERMNGTLQDRLVKELRLAGIDTIASANVFLEAVFLPKLNQRFAVAPADDRNGHVPASPVELAAALCLIEERVVGKDQCIAWHGLVLQLRPGRGQAGVAGKRVQVREGLDGSVCVYRSEGDQLIEHALVGSRPRLPAMSQTLAERMATHKGQAKPAANHPWRGPVG